MEGSGPRARRALALPDGWRAGLAIAAATAGLLLIAAAWLVFAGGRGWGFDFSAYYLAAERLLATGTPYAPETLRGKFDLGPVFGLYVYSPLPALLVTPLASLEQDLATHLWFALRAMLLVAACLLLPVSLRLRLAMIGISAASLPVLLDLSLGNVSIVVTFLSVVAWRLGDHPLAGLPIGGALFVRPTVGLLIGWWLVRRRWRPALAAIAGAGLLAAASVLVMGLQPYLDYLILLGNIGQVTGVPNNLDLGSLALRLGADGHVARLALYAGYLLALGAVLVSLRRDREISYVVATMAMLLVAPLLWDHYLTQLILPAALLASRGRWWGLALPLAAWLPHDALTLVAVAGLVAPLMAPDRGPPALAAWREHDATAAAAAQRS